MKVYPTYLDVYYSTYTAMQIELSKNGFFITLAPANHQKNEKGNITFNWSQKVVSKMSIAEIAHLKKAVKYYSDDVEYFKAGAQRLFEKYTNYLFIHKSMSSKIQTGLCLYGDSLQYVIRNLDDKKKDKFFNISMIDIARLEEFLDFIIKAYYHQKALIATQKILDRNAPPQDFDQDFVDETNYRDSDFNSSF